MRITKYKTTLSEDGKAVLEKELSVNYPELDRKMNGPEKVVRLAKEFLHLDDQTEEYLYMICMNSKLELTSVFEISHGNVNSSIIGAREIFQKALLANAVSIILMHNHPSGDSTPSREDIEVTKRIVEAGRVVEIELIDHVIIGRPMFTSLKEKGYMWE